MSNPHQHLKQTAFRRILYGAFLRCQLIVRPLCKCAQVRQVNYYTGCFTAAASQPAFPVAAAQVVGAGRRSSGIVLESFALCSRAIIILIVTGQEHNNPSVMAFEQWATNQHSMEEAAVWSWGN